MVEVVEVGGEWFGLEMAGRWSDDAKHVMSL